MNDIVERMRTKFAWAKVEVPKIWRPETVGEEIIGFFGGKTLRDGKWGQYEVVIVHVPNGGSLLLSGTGIIQLVDTAMLSKGDPIRVIWQGLRETASGHTMKVFDLMIAEGEALPEEALPELQ